MEEERTTAPASRRSYRLLRGAKGGDQGGQTGLLHPDEPVARMRARFEAECGLPFCGTDQSARLAHVMARLRNSCDQPLDAPIKVLNEYGRMKTVVKALVLPLETPDGSGGSNVKCPATRAPLRANRALHWHLYAHDYNYTIAARVAGADVEITSGAQAMKDVPGLGKGSVERIDAWLAFERAGGAAAADPAAVAASLPPLLDSARKRLEGD